MKNGDPILVQVDADSWRRGTFLGQREITEGRGENQHELMYKVGIGEPHYFNYEEKEVYPHSVKRFIPLSEEDATAKHQALSWLCVFRIGLAGSSRPVHRNDFQTKGS